MTGAKPLVLLAYGLIGLALMVLAPLLHQRRVSNGEAEAVGARITPPIRMVFGMLIGLCAMAFLPWWVREPGHWFRLALSPLQVAAVLSLTFAVSWMLTRQNTAARDSCAHRRWRALVYAVFAMVLLCLVFSTGWLLTYTGPGLWHHWGAYVGPALLVAEGAHPWYDIPVQYGLGVTLLLAQGCQIDCWSALYWLAGAMTAAMTALLAYLALQFNGSRHPLSVLATVAIVLVCGLFWTASPRGLAAPLTYPSTTGLRFLPGVLVLTLLVRHARLGAVGRTPPAWGHVLWLACILWSPEAGLHATMLWAPYFVWLHTWAQGAGRPSIRFIRAAARLALVLVGGLTLTALGYRLLWGHFPEAGAYLVYLRHPPGPLPVNPWGTVWFALVCMVCWGLGWFYMARRACTNPGLATASWLSALFCFASFTYYLGRSHDNNILNLLPFFALMLQAARAIVPTGAVKTLSTTLLAACVGWMPVFGFDSLSKVYTDGRLLEFAPHKFAMAFSRDPARGNFYDRPPQARADLERALQTIRHQFGESVQIFERLPLVDTENVGAPWSAFSAPANFAFIPPDQRRIYLRRVAQRLHRTGWVLYEEGDEVFGYLSDYDSVYRRAEEMRFGAFRARRYLPHDAP